jgi:hypothetical protein
LGRRRPFYALLALGDLRLSEHAVKELSVRGFWVHASSIGTIPAAHVVKKGADPVSEEPNRNKDGFRRISSVHVVECWAPY